MQSAEMIGSEIGCYRVARRLGAGGCGTVYEVLHARFNKRFALKILHRDLAAHREPYARFIREAQVIAEIGHPHIIVATDFDHTEDGYPFIVMELLEGEDLGARIAREGAMPVSQAARLLAEVASALQAAHARGVVHRDLKPANIFLARFGARRDFPKVLDFGLSKVDTSQLTHSEAFMGTPLYMPPELVLGQAAVADARCDVYALGMVAYEMLAGAPPFQVKDIRVLFEQIVHAAPPPLAERRPDVPAELAAIVERALSKQPSARFADAGELLQALAAATGAADLDVTAAPADAPARATRTFTGTMVPVPSGDIAGTTRLGLACTVRVPATVAAQTLVPRSRDAEHVARCDGAVEPPPPTTTTMLELPRRRAPALVVAAVVLLLGAAALWLLRGAPSRPQDAGAPTLTAAATRPLPRAVDSAPLPLVSRANAKTPRPAQREQTRPSGRTIARAVLPPTSSLATRSSRTRARSRVASRRVSRARVAKGASTTRRRVPRRAAKRAVPARPPARLGEGTMAF